MDRRRFLVTSLAGVLAAPRRGDAQQVGKVYRIGILSELAQPTTATNRVFTEDVWRTPFRQRGYVEGQNAVFETRWAEEHFERLPALVEEFIRLKVDIIMTSSTPAAVAAKNATTSIPIITMSADPIGAGLVASLARPSGNVTGVFIPVADLAAKRLQLLREAVPDLDSVVILWNPLNQTAHVQLKHVESAAKAMGVATHAIELRGQGDLERVSKDVIAKRARGLIFVQDPITLRAAAPIAELAAKHRLPGSHAYRVFPDAGGLMSYGVNIPGLFEAAVGYADKVLRGARPASLPMEQPTKFELVINMKTARALGLTIPPSLLARADQVIE